MFTPRNTNVIREWGFGKCFAVANCGWMGRERNLTDANRVKAVQDCRHHAQTCKECK